MTSRVRSSLTSAAQPALRAWNRLPMRTQSRISICLPLLAVLVSAGLAISGNLQRADIETDIQRKFEMSGALENMTTLMVNAETGMRGYLLTSQGEFLEPFDEATTGMPGAMDRLTALAQAEPGEKPRQDKLARIQQLRALTDQQLADLSLQKAYVGPGGRSVSDAELVEHLARGKDLMDRIRVEADAMQDEERGLLDDRIADVESIRVRDYVSVALALVVGVGMRLLAWYMFRRGTLRRVQHLTENVRSLHRGDPMPFPPPDKNDELGQLESAVHALDPVTARPDPAPRAPAG